MKRAPYKAKKGTKFAIYAYCMATNPWLSGPGALFGEELKIAFLISKESRVSGQSQQLVYSTNHTKDGLLGFIILGLIENRVVRNAIYFLLKVVAIASWPSRLLYYRLDTLESLVLPIALYTLKMSLLSAASSHHSQLFCLAAFIALK
jgi:hypothetical protein